MVNNQDMDYLNDLSVRETLLGRIQAALNGEIVSEAPGSVSDREVQPSLFGPET